MLALLGLCWPQGVQAQDDPGEAIAPSEVIEGDAGEVGGPNGVGSGNVAFHPGVSLEGGFDSNVFFDDAQERVTTSPVLGVVPKLSLKTRRPTSVDLTLDASVLYLQYLSEDQKVLDQSGFDLKLDGKAIFNPNGAIALKISDNFTRTNEAPNGVGFDSYNRVFNRLSGGVLIQPGGKVLTAEVGGAFSIFSHTYLPDLDRQMLSLGADVKWRFLPKTAVIAQLGWDFISYDTKQRTIPFHDDESIPSFLEPFVNDTGIQNIDSKPLRLQAGLAGLVGPRFSVVLLGGYGAGFYEEGEDFSGFIGRAEVAYEIGPTSRFRLGYMRDFADSSFANFFTFHKVYARHKQQLFGRLDLSLEGAFQLQEYALNPGPVLDQVSVDGVLGANAFSTDRRVDPVVLAKGELTFFITQIFNVGVRYQLDVNASDFVMITGIVAPDDLRDPNDINTQGTATAQFVKHRVFLTTGVQW